MTRKTPFAKVFWLFIALISMSSAFAQGGIFIQNCSPNYPCELDAQFSFTTNDCDASFQGLFHPPQCNTREIWLVQGANQSYLGNTLNYTFPQSGVYEVCHIVQGLDAQFTVLCSDTVCQQVIINCPAPCNPCDIEEPQIGFNTTDGCHFNFLGSHTGSTCPEQIYEWNILDASFNPIDTIAGQNLTNYEFPATGQYLACLKIYVLDGNGNEICYDRSCSEVTAECDCPAPVLRDISFTNDCYTYDFFTDNPGPISGEVYDWDLDGDGHFEATGGSTTITFPGDGTYPIALKIINGCDSIIIYDEVEVSCCTGDPEERDIRSEQSVDDCNQFELSFTPGPQPGEAYEWDIDGNGSIDDYGPVVTVTFSANGIYPVTLYISNGCGVTRVTYELEVDCCELPEARSILFTQSSSDCYTYDFHPSILGHPGEIIDWDLNNDGVYGSSTTITFPADDTYEVSLRIRNECGERIVTLELEVDCNVECDWPKGYGNNSPTKEQAYGVVLDAVGNVFVHGYVDHATTFDDGITTIPGGGFLAKYDSCGLLLWVLDVSAYGRYSTKMKIDNLGNPIVLASHPVNANPNFDDEYVLTRFNNSDGSAIWSVSIEANAGGRIPSFDINMNTNEVYLTANMGIAQSLKIKQNDGTLIVNETYNSTFSAPNNTSYIVKLNTSGNQIWQDHTIATRGQTVFDDVVVEENTNRVYIAGTFSNNLLQASFTYASNTAIVTNPSAYPNSFNLDFFLASYDALGNISYSVMNPSIEGAPRSQIEYSNIDQQIYYHGQDGSTPTLYLLGTFGNTISSTPTPGHSSNIHYNQTENYLLTCGTYVQCPTALSVSKYEGTNNIWDYQVPNPCFSPGMVQSTFADPTSERIYIVGFFVGQSLNFNATDILPHAGGRDVFIARIKDEGSSVSYKQGASSDAIALGQIALEETSIFNVYPNPTNDVIYISTSAKYGQLELLNIQGAIIARAKVQTDGGKTVFDLANHPSGLYLIRFTDEVGNVELKKLVKY